MNMKKERRERSHETILQSASRLLRERGISGARVAEVMAGAGLTVGGFYAHFDSKEALIDEALRRTGTEMRGKLFAELGERTGIDTILRRYLSRTHRDAVDRGCPLPTVVAEIGANANEHQGALAEQIGALVRGIEDHLPEDRPDVSPRQLALGLAALMIGGLSLARALRGTPMSDEILRACRALGRRAAHGEDEGETS
jgi:TetR/AcrR family transcriptional regulator, transcriptional repressor for nem operon